MTSRTRVLLAAVLLGTSLAAQSGGKVEPPKPTPGKKPPRRVAVTDLDECRAALRAVARRHGEAKVISASYRQERTTALLRRPLVSKGALLFRMDPACLLFRGAGDKAASIRMTFEHYEVYRPKRGTLERTPLADRSLPEALFQAFTPGPIRLEKTFTIASGWRTGSLLEIRLKPKDQTNDFLQDFTLAIDEKDHELRRIEYRDPQNDRVALILRDLQLDPKLDPEAFDLGVAKGVKVLVHPPVGGSKTEKGKDKSEKQPGPDRR